QVLSVATVTDARGKTVTNNYDSNNRLFTGVTDPNGTITNYTYNPKNDQLQSVSKQVGGQTVIQRSAYSGVLQGWFRSNRGLSFTDGILCRHQHTKAVQTAF
ncbi:hypothetical protein CLOSTMETH_02534, partial [[Clostridium] methylpentosum DSM 5476]